MKSRIVTLSIVLFLNPLACQFAGAKDAISEGGTATNNTVLREAEITDMKIRKTTKREWVKSLDSRDMPHGSAGVLQEVETKGVKARIHYTEFATAEEAHQAAEFHIKNVASIFLAGLWNGAVQKVIGDESWYVHDETITVLLIRSGRTCVLISCHDGDAQKRNQIAEIIGKRIEDKIKLGARVIVPGDR